MRSVDFFVIGYFGFATNKFDGQTVKTRSIHQLLESKLKAKVPYFDTEKLKSNKMSILFTFFQLLGKKNLIYIPGKNNLTYFFPFLFFLSKIFKYNIQYFVVGGWLPEFIKDKKGIAKKLGRISGIYVETRKMEDILTTNYKFSNIIWFPNFRFSTSERLQKTKSENLRIVYLSRITKKKGIELIFWLLGSLADDYNNLTIQIDFYGPIDENDKDYFNEQINLFQNTKYKGIADPETVQKILAGYDLLVFPTRYEGEGCPGIIIDAYFAGIPVLATNWKYNSEFIIDGETGYLFDIDEKIKFRKILLELAENKSCLLEMGLKAKEFSKKFNSENAWRIIKSNLKTVCI
jgi:glycosyltransferase involved in cell wall biosynthesis